MHLIINRTLLLAALILGTVPMIFTWILRRYLPELRRKTEGADYQPPVSIILPCKGIDPGFRENIRSVIAQDYADFEVVFAVADVHDPAHAVLADILGEAGPGRSLRLVVAGRGFQRAQKLTNQLAALGQASKRSEVFVFLDSDTRPDAGFLRRLAAPLRNESIGVTTGFRWYHCRNPGLGTLLRATWVAGALPFLVYPKTTFAWGGAMAIRRDVFLAGKIAALWDQALSDDMTLTIAVRGLGMEVLFVPSCLTVSDEQSTVRETLEFTNRQSVISRIYFPPLWWSTALGHATVNFLIAYGLINSVLWTRHGGAAYALGALCVLVLPLQLLNAVLMFHAIKELIPASVRGDFLRLKWVYVFVSTLTSLMTLANTAFSASTRRITWRGIRYELKSRRETLVLGN